MPRSSVHMPVARMPHIIWISAMRAVDHGRVDDLALTGDLPLPQRGQDADDQEHRAAAEVADQVQRRHRPLVLPADGVQDAVQRDVVDVVAGRSGCAGRF